MALVRLAGGELLNAHEWSTVNVAGNPAIDTVVVHGSGEASYRLDWESSSAAYLRMNYTPVADRWQRFRAMFRFSDLPSASRVLFQAFNGTTALMQVRLTSAGVLQFVSGGTGTGPTLSPDTWYCVELGVNGSGVSSPGIDGILRVDEVQYQTYNIGLSQVPDNWRFGNTGAQTADPVDFWVDDVAVTDDSGSGAWAGWIGPGEVHNLKPVSDIAIGADWKLGDNTAPSSNAYDSINNIPPVGLAEGSATAGSQLRDGVANVSDPAAKADFELESFDEAGVPGNHTVRAAVLWAEAGCQTTLNIPGFDFEGLSNPVVATQAQAGGSTSAVGTYTTGWNFRRNSPVESPTVVKGTRPQVRLRKNLSHTNRLHICAVGLMVETQADPSALSGGTIASGEAFGVGEMTGGALSELNDGGAIPSGETIGVGEVVQSTSYPPGPVTGFGSQSWGGTGPVTIDADVIGEVDDLAILFVVQLNQAGEATVTTSGTGWTKAKSYTFTDENGQPRNLSLWWRRRTATGEYPITITPASGGTVFDATLVSRRNVIPTGDPIGPHIVTGVQDFGESDQYDEVADSSMVASGGTFPAMFVSGASPDYIRFPDDPSIWYQPGAHLPFEYEYGVLNKDLQVGGISYFYNTGKWEGGATGDAVLDWDVSPSLRTTDTAFILFSVIGLPAPDEDGGLISGGAIPDAPAHGVGVTYGGTPRPRVVSTGEGDITYEALTDPWMTPALPPTRAIGDILVLFTSYRGAGGFPEESTDWTLVADISGSWGIGVFTRLVDGTEAAPSVRWTGVPGAVHDDPAVAQVACFRNLSGEVDVVGTVSNGTSSTFNQGGNDITTTTAGDTVIVFAARGTHGAIWGIPSLTDQFVSKAKVYEIPIGTEGSELEPEFGFQQAWQFGQVGAPATIPDQNIPITHPGYPAINSGVQIAFKPSSVDLDLEQFNLVNGGSIPSQEQIGPGGAVYREGDLVGGGEITSDETFGVGTIVLGTLIPLTDGTVPSEEEFGVGYIRVARLLGTPPGVGGEVGTGAPDADGYTGPDSVYATRGGGPELEVFITNRAGTLVRRMYQYRDLDVTHPISDGRTGKFNCPIYDINALNQSNIQHFVPLQNFVKVFYRGFLIFLGPIVKPVFNMRENDVEVNCVDCSFWLRHHHFHRGDAALTGLPYNEHTLWKLAEAARLTDDEMAMGAAQLPIVKGIADDTIFSSTYKYNPELGANVWDSMIELSESAFGPDFDLKPIDEKNDPNGFWAASNDDPKPMAQLNAWGDMGADKSTRIHFHFGFGRTNLENFIYEPDGAATINRFIGQSEAGNLREARFEQGMGDEGIVERWEQASEGITSAKGLEEWARGHVEAYGKPLQAFTIEPTWDQGLVGSAASTPWRYPGSYYPGDRIRAIGRLGRLDVDLIGRVIKVTMKQVNAAENVRAEIELVPEEVEINGVTVHKIVKPEPTMRPL